MSARILLIEDNSDNLDLMVFILKAFGYSPLSATNGQAGLDIASREPIDLIVCDIQMPVLDGYQVAHHLKNQLALSRIPLIAVTSYAMVGDRDKVLSAGFDGYIAKPINPETFVQQLESFLQPHLRTASKNTTLQAANGTVSSSEVTSVTPHALEDSSEEVPVASLARLSPNPRRTSILIVDNSTINLDLMVTTLKSFNYEIAAAESAEQAIELAHQQPPDLIVSDLHMPGQDGFDFITTVKADPELRNIPFVFISSTVFQDKDRMRGLSLGANKFLIRPIDPEMLVGELEHCLHEARSSDG